MTVPLVPDDVSAVWQALLRDASELPRHAARLGIELERLIEWRGVLVDTAFPKLQSAVVEHGWVQVNVSLAPRSEAYVRLLEGPLLDQLSRWVDEGFIDNWFFVHKTPGIRLRIRGHLGALRPASTRLMDSVAERGRGIGWTFGRYVPELHLFGGSVGMELTHRVFTADSGTVMGRHQLELGKQTSLGAHEFSLFALQLCVSNVTADRWEQWDVWSRLRWTGRLRSGPDVPVPSKLAVDWAVKAVFDPSTIDMSDKERALLGRFTSAMTDLSAAVSEMQDKGLLRISARELAPFWIAFHWNRMGFPIDQQRILAHLMVTVLNPRGPSVTGTT